MKETMPHLILASTSMYRRELLQRLRLPFASVSPGTDETPRSGETPAALSERLSLAKAHAVAVIHPDAVVIGSDQVAECDGRTVGKPGSHASAVEQLRQLSGREVVFHTSVAVVRGGAAYSGCVRVPAVVRFRTLSELEIETYLRLDEPYDCTGSAKCETLGIGLLESVRSDDPTALIGLPLIATCGLLRAAGLDPLLWAGAVHVD